METLKMQLKSSKIFMNMIIHDLRNPTVSSRMGTTRVLEEIDAINLLALN